MKNTIVIFLSVILMMTSCNNEDIPECEDCNFTCLGQNEPKNCSDDWECGFKVIAQSKVDLDEISGVSSGGKNVFQMVRTREEDPEIADDQFKEYLVFELDESQESFSVENSDLVDMRVHLRQVCFCSDIDFRAITVGCLQGEKQADGTWFVQAYFEDPFGFGIDAQFLN